MTTLKLGLPKGSLQDSTVQLFARAGFTIYVSAIVASVDPRSRNRVHAHPRPGDGALRRRRRARLRPDRAGLDRRTSKRTSLACAARAGGRSPSTRSRASAKSSGSWQRRKVARFKKPQDLEAPRSPPSWCVPAYFDRLGVNVNVEFSWGATSEALFSPMPSSKRPRPGRRCGPTGCGFWTR